MPINYMMRLDMTLEVREEFNAWAGTKHIDDLLAAGFLSAVRFKAYKSRPEYLHLYELPSPALLQSEAYQNVGKNENATWYKLQHGVFNWPCSLYEQVIAVKVPETPHSFPTPRKDSIGGVNSRHLITVQMDVEAGREDELSRWHREEHIPTLLQAKGMVNGRLCQRVARHPDPEVPCRDPEWVGVYEMEGPETLQDQKVEEANGTEWAKQMHTVTSDERLCVLERITPV